MSRKRRHAIDFTDSLNSFRNTMISDSNFYSCVLQSFSEDSLESCRKKDGFMSKDSVCTSEHSTTLISSLTKDSLMNDATNLSGASCSQSQSAPDLNKRIDSFQNENSCTFYKDDIGTTRAINVDKENSDPQYLIPSKCNDNISKTVELLHGLSRKALPCMNERSSNVDLTNENSARDSNYNIQTETTNVTVVPQDSILKEKNKYMDNDCNASFPKLVITDSTNKDGEIQATDNVDVRQFEPFLHSLDNQLNEMREMKDISRTHHILRRLSDKYARSPKTFTEKLVTVIEESITKKEDDACNRTGIDLSRLTAEFRKMCKYIEDESVPEWPESLLSLHASTEKTLLSPTCVNNTSAKVNKSQRSLPSTPTNASSRDRLKNCKRLFTKMQRNSLSNSTDNVCTFSLNENENASFEDLEAQCKRLFPDEKEYSHLKRAVSLPCLFNMNDIRFICEQQMASLNDSNDTDLRQEEDMVACTCNRRDECSCSSTTDTAKHKDWWTIQYHPKEVQEVHCKLKDLRCENTLYLKQKPIRFNAKSETTPVKSNKITSNYITVDPDELERTLLLDIAEKRKRCLDTAKLLTEINTEQPEPFATQKSHHASPIFTGGNNSHSLSNNETKFLNTLMSCKNYHTYLKKQKPFFDILENSFSPIIQHASEEHDNEPVEKITALQTVLGTNKSTDDKKRNLSLGMKFNNIDESLALGKDCKGVNGKDWKPRYFVTPGKSPVTRNINQKRVYFTDADSAEKKKVRNNILKSPHARQLYRLNYNTVTSPVGMYIRGTDMQLIKNVRSKTNSPLHTPLKENAKASPVGTLRHTPSPNNINRIQEKLSQKFKISPKSSLTPRLYGNQPFMGKEVAKKISDNQSTPNTHFTLPKVSYQLPLQVRTIREQESPKVGNRMKQLLHSAQSKIVVRHQGRVNTVLQKKGTGNSEDEGIVEINYMPEDESVHIEKTASKTNFINWKKNN